MDPSCTSLTVLYNNEEDLPSISKLWHNRRSLFNDKSCVLIYGYINDTQKERVDAIVKSHQFRYLCEYFRSRTGDYIPLVDKGKHHLRYVNDLPKRLFVLSPYAALDVVFALSKLYIGTTNFVDYNKTSLLQVYIMFLNSQNLYSNNALSFNTMPSPVFPTHNSKSQLKGLSENVNIRIIPYLNLTRNGDSPIKIFAIENYLTQKIEMFYCVVMSSDLTFQQKTYTINLAQIVLKQEQKMLANQSEIALDRFDLRPKKGYYYSNIAEDQKHVNTHYKPSDFGAEMCVHGNTVSTVRIGKKFDFSLASWQLADAQVKEVSKKERNLVHSSNFYDDVIMERHPMEKKKRIAVRNLLNPDQDVSEEHIPTGYTLKNNNVETNNQSNSKKKGNHVRTKPYPLN